MVERGDVDNEHRTEHSGNLNRVAVTYPQDLSVQGKAHNPLQCFDCRVVFLNRP